MLNHYRPILAVLLALLSLSSCEKLGDYNAKNFDQFDPNSPLQLMTAPQVPRNGAVATLNDNRGLLVGGTCPPRPVGPPTPLERFRG